MKEKSILVTTSDTNSDYKQILLQGQLIIRNAGEIKRELISALKSSQNLKLVFRNVIKLDLSVLQLLIAFQKSAFALNRKISFDIELPDYITPVLQNAGLQNILAIKHLNN